MRDATVSVMVDAALKGAVLLLLATLFTLVLRRASAARRHLVWSVAVTALLLIPLLSWVVPAWGVLPTVTPLPESTVTQQVDAVLSQGVEFDPASVPAEPWHASGELHETATRPIAARFDFSRLLLFVWLSGAMLVLLSIVVGFTRVFWLGRAAERWQSGRVYELARALCKEQRVCVQLLAGPENSMPMTWGLWRARVLMPRGAQGWPDARLRAVLRHELAHVRRRDAWWQLIAELACALHWFNPLAWYAAHRMRVEREHACDDAVLTAGARPSEYASELLGIARTMRAARATSLAAIAMARPRQLEGRLLAVLDAQRRRDEVSRRWPAWAAAALLVLPLAALAPTAEPAAALPTAEVTAAPRRIAGQPAPQPVLEAAVLSSRKSSAQSPDCLKSSVQHMSTSVDSDDDHTRVKWETRSCKGVIEIHGQARIAGDLSGFQSIAPGGQVEIETQEPKFKRKLTLTPSNGRFAYAYEVNGDRRAWDREGQEWLASVLTLLVRSGGYGAEERVDYLLRAKGVTGVLDEVTQMTSDHTKRRYLSLMLDRTTLNPGAARTVLETAGRVLNSDYELTELLMAFTRKYGFTPESRAGYISAVRSLESDYERGRALHTLIDRASLSRDDQLTVLALAADMRSNHERAQVLKRMSAKADLADARVQEAYTRAAVTMDSDYELRQVLSNLLRTGRLGAGAIDLVLTAAGSLESNHERAELLTQLINTQTFTAGQRTRLVNLTDQIESEYERGRVASLLIRKLNN